MCRKIFVSIGGQVYVIIRIVSNARYRLSIADTAEFFELSNPRHQTPHQLYQHMLEAIPFGNICHTGPNFFPLSSMSLLRGFYV